MPIFLSDCEIAQGDRWAFVHDGLTVRIGMGLGRLWHLKPPGNVVLFPPWTCPCDHPTPSTSRVDMPTISGIYFGFISLFFLCLGRAEANRYHLKDSFVGEEFFKGWNWGTFQDPTHGRVNYVDQKAAIAKNLSVGGSYFCFGLCSPRAI